MKVFSVSRKGDLMWVNGVGEEDDGMENMLVKILRIQKNKLARLEN